MSEDAVTLSPSSQRALLAFARGVFDGVSGRETGPRLPEEVRAQSAPVIVGLFDREGSFLAEVRVEPNGRGLDQVVADAVSKAREELGRRGTEGSCFLHLMVVGLTGRFPNLGIAGLFGAKVYEPRVTGLVYEIDGERYELSPLRALCLDLGSRGSRQYLARRAGFPPTEMPSRADLEIEVYRVIHFGERLPDRACTRFFRGHRFVAPGEVSTRRVVESLRAIGQWYEHNVIDSEVTYLYRPATRTYENGKRTIVRSTMAAWILNRLARFLEDDRLLALGEQPVRFYLERYFQMSAALSSGRLEPSPVPLENGYLVANHYTAAAFLVAAILERGELGRYRDEADLLIGWCLGFRREDGTLWTEWGQNQLFMPGQLLLVLAYLFGETGEERYREIFEGTFAAYRPSWEALMDLGPETCTPYAPAWVTQPAAEMYRLTGDPRYPGLILGINDRVVEWYEANARYQVYPDYDGVLAPKTGHYGDNSITAAALESLVDAADVARHVGDEVRLDRYLRVIRHTTAYLLRLQYTLENTYYIRSRERVLGGFKRSLVDNTVWCDNVWHAASAFMKIVERRQLDP